MSWLTKSFHQKSSKIYQDQDFIALKEKVQNQYLDEPFKKEIKENYSKFDKKDEEINFLGDAEAPLVLLNQAA